MKSLSRFFVDFGDNLRLEGAPSGRTVELNSIDSHHIRDVLRLKVGDPLIAISRETGTAFDATISEITTFVTITIHEKRGESSGNSKVGTLFVPLLKNEHTELVLEKCTELGVRKFVVWQAHRSIVKFEQREGEKIDRWNKILEAASKQCARHDIPELKTSRSLVEALSDSFIKIETEDLGIFCSLTGEAKRVRDVPATTGYYHVILGPEGDFTDEEVSLLTEKHSMPVTLGTNILRSETAAIAVVAMLDGSFM